MAPRKINLLQAAEDIDRPFEPHIAGDVNDAQVKIAKFGEAFEWHAHPDEDEAFLVLKGRIALDFRDETVELGEGEFLVVPRGIEHRPRAMTVMPLVLMVEPASTVNTGNAQSERTVLNPARL